MHLFFVKYSKSIVYILQTQSQENQSSAHKMAIKH